MMAARLDAQPARLIATEAPGAESRHEFTRITGVFELTGGKVVVLDRDDATLWLVDFPANSTTQIGRHGSGPREYRRPFWLLPLGGDSVAVFDDAGVRGLVIDRDGKPSGFVPVTPRREGIGDPGALHGDGRGWFYGESRLSRVGADGLPQPADSAALFRWRVGSVERELVGYVHRPPPAGSTRSASGTVRPGDWLRPGTRNRWIPGPDGTIAIAGFEPYRVTYLLPGGERRTGPPMPYDVVPLDDSVKRAFLSEFEGRANSDGIVVDGSGRSTAISGRSPAMDPSTIPWMSVVPPFRSDASVAFGPDGLLWVQRATFGNEGGRYDLIGANGELIDRVRLPAGHRVVGFGRSVMYIVRRDADDVEYLQKRPLPR
jgi:hypothetical protein